MTELENSNLQPEPEDQPTKPNVAALELVQRLEAMGCVHHYGYHQDHSRRRSSPWSRDYISSTPMDAPILQKDNR